MQRRLPLLVLLVCAVAFALGIAQLFKLRFESGDVYPPYSSLRSDPLGVSAFYESLEQLPGVSVRRDFSMSDELPTGRNIAYLHLGGDSSQWLSFPKETFTEIETFLNGGGRLVIALMPETSSWRQSQSARQRKREMESKPSKDGKAEKPKSARNRKRLRRFPDDDEFPDQGVLLKDRWGVDFAFKGMAGDDGRSYESIEVGNSGEPSLADSISWHSGLVFTNLDKSWRTIYARRSEPVLIERKFGAGSVVFSTDSYFVSNEAMQKERHAALLAWLVGPGRQIVFDEAHFGIMDNPGVAALIRKYRLHGVVAALLLLAGLFIWKNSVSFAPTWEDARAETSVTGKDSAAGLINLLRRHIAPGDLLRVCLAEWEKSFGHGTVSASKLQAVRSEVAADQALAPGERNAARTYLAICRALKKNSGLNPEKPEHQV